MKKRLPINSSILEFLVLTLLAMASIFYLNGCTAKALQLAKDKASPENAEHWKIKTVVSAFKQEKGDVSVCVELNESGETGKPKLDTITLPLSSLSEDTDATKRLKLRSAECYFDNATCYWYPIEKTRRGCKSFDIGTQSSAFALPVENISVNNKSRHQLYSLLDNLNKNQPITEKIYAVSIVSDEANTNGETDGADDEIVENRAKRSKDISLIFWPARTDQQRIRPIIITGVYEDNSTGLYYLMVPFAFAGDVVAVTVAVVVLAFLNCPTCFAAMNN